MPSKGTEKLIAPDPPLDTPALRDDNLKFSYAIARGEMGVLSFEPYKSMAVTRILYVGLFAEPFAQALSFHSGPFEQYLSQRTRLKYFGLFSSPSVTVATLSVQTCPESSFRWA